MGNKPTPGRLRQQQPIGEEKIRRTAVNREYKKDIDNELENASNLINDLLGMNNKLSKELTTTKALLVEALKANDILKERISILSDEPKDSKIIKECSICMEKIENIIVMIPCAHTASCENCISQIKNCSLCGREIASSLKIYL
jgi:hypothetical protein